MGVAWVGLVVPAMLGGCLATGLYTTPEPLPPHAFEIEVAPETWSLDRDIQRDNYFGQRHEEDDGAFGVPAMVARFGLENGLEVGVGTFRLDLKMPMGVGEWAALAFDPIIRGVKTQDGIGLVIEAPLVAAVNLGKRVTIVANGGLAFVRLLSPNQTDQGGQEESLNWMTVRAGFGVHLRITDAIAVQPEVAYLRAIGMGRLDWVSGGIAVLYRGWK